MLDAHIKLTTLVSDKRRILHMNVQWSCQNGDSGRNMGTIFNCVKKKKKKTSPLMVAYAFL